jgi:uncharacterized protein Smg (DUF494 family)
MEHLSTRLRELLLLLLEAMDARQESESAGVREIHQMVAAAGFGEQEVEDLLHWLRSRWEPEPGETAWLTTRQVAQASVGALRQLGAREDELLTPEAFGYLLGLVRERQITAEQMETLIQFAQLSPDAPLTTAHLDELVDRVVLAPEHHPATAAGRIERTH